jgi:LysR family transcriptional activator of nhaA
VEWLNYHHLLYFWTVAHEGSVSKAAERLRLSQPTVSGQVRQLEQSLGEPLFERRGRRLVLTEVGRVVYRYADEIFGLGRELLETLRGQAAGRPQQLIVGVANAVPKLIAFRLLRPGVQGAAPVRLVCREDDVEALVAQLSTFTLDVVIADRPATPHAHMKVFSHLLGESDIAFFAPPALAARLRRRFPASLANARLLLPTMNTALRRGLDEWLDRQGIRPHIAGEFEDPALMSVFAHSADAAFPAPAVIAGDVRRAYRVGMAGHITAVRERYYAISVERRVTNPGVRAVTGAARDELFT